MQAGSSTISFGRIPFFNPWQPVNDMLAAWSSVVETFSTNIVRTLRPQESKTTVFSPSEKALEQTAKVQWLLYQRHLARHHWNPSVPPGRECWRFTLWSSRHSENFRKLMALYQIDWLSRYADLTDEAATGQVERHDHSGLEQLFREIELHLYQ